MHLLKVPYRKTIKLLKKRKISNKATDEEIKIENLPDKIEIQQENLNQLDRVVIESISEDLVG